MAMYLRQSTASQEILLAPFVDETDGKTAEVGLTIANTDIKLWKEGGTSEASKNSGGATHIASGRYYCVLDATDTDTVGKLEVNVHVSGALPVRREFMVLEEAVYDAFFAASAPGYVANAPVNVAQFGGSAGTFASGRPEVNLSHVAGSAVSTSTAQLGVNVVNAGGTAWGSGAITAASLAADAITAAKIADGAIDRAAFAADTGMQAVRSNTAQAGASASITLDASASSTTDFYKGLSVYLTGGTGAGQARLVTAYNGTTKVATVSPAWATAPDNTSTFAVLAAAGSDLVTVAGSAVSASAGLLNANATQISGDATAADNLEAMLDGTGGVTLTTGITGNVTGNLSGSVGSVTGNVGGNVVGSVASVASGGITSSSFAANAITAAAIAADAIGASELAADAVAEIQSGLSTLTTGDVSGAVWNAATASYGSAGSYGLLVETNLDATVSSRLAPTVSGRTLDVTTTGEAGIDWANVGSPTTAVDLSGTTISTSQAVASVSGAVGSVTGNVGGNLAGSVGSVATGGITAGSLAADCITAAKIAADAGTEIATAVWAGGTRTLTSLSGLTVDTVTTLTNLPAVTANWLTAAGLAADAVTEIQTGLATAAALTTVAGYIDTEVAAIKAKTDSLTFTVAGQVDCNVQSINDVTVVGTGASGNKWRA